MLNAYRVNGAVVNGTFIDATVRSIVYGYASAVATPIANAFDASRRFIVNAYLQANAVVTPKVLARSVDFPQAAANATLLARSFCLNPLESRYAEALASVVPTAIRREIHRSPVFMDASATVSGVGRAWVRGPAWMLAEAQGFVVANSQYSPPYDEPAIEANTFVVRYEPNVFTVR